MTSNDALAAAVIAYGRTLTTVVGPADLGRVTPDRRPAWAYAARRYYWRNRDRALAWRRAQTAALAERSDEELAADLARLRPGGFRTCPRCGRHLEVSAFGRDRGSPDGLTSSCRTCRAA